MIVLSSTLIFLLKIHDLREEEKSFSGPFLESFREHTSLFKRKIYGGNLTSERRWIYLVGRSEHFFMIGIRVVRFN